MKKTTKAKKLSAQLSAPHDHTGELKRLSRIKGQVSGIERMINDQRYCPDIVHQIKAVRSALKALETSIIEGHMKSCMKTAIASRKKEVIQEKMDEILILLKEQN